MIFMRQNLFFTCWIVIFTVKTMQKELGIGQDLSEESTDLSQMKWDSILQPEISSKFPQDEHNLDFLDSFENGDQEIQNNFKLSKSEVKYLSEDEVFTHAVKSPRKILVSDKLGKVEPDKPTNVGSTFVSNISPEVLSVSEIPSKSQKITIEDLNMEDNKAVESILPPGSSSSELNNSEVTPEQPVEDLNTRSFIFNPNAEPQQQFQNCTTPKNESGHCRYLQHCLIPTIVSSLNHFMEYVCVIEERFIGVCCPDSPVTLIVVQEEKEPKKSVDNLKNNITSDPSACGVGTNTRIVGGMKADPKAWPWMVALFSKFRKQFFCGGALINDRYVLTAAHCTFGLFNNGIIARLGEYDFKNDGETHIEYAVSEIKRHGQYNRRSLKHDIALLKLEKPVVFSKFIRTICLPEEEKRYIGDEATLAGWGNIAGGGRTSNVLQQASFPVVSNEECSKGHLLPISSSLICTSAEAGDKGACNGDSGGPLMLLDKNNRWKVIGLVSWGRRGCSPEFPTVYTRVSHYLEWIKKHSE